MVDVLFEDNHCLVVDKPAGLLSQGDETGDSSLVDWAKSYLKTKYAKPGEVYLGLIHRLDRPTSGVVLLARTSKAAARLSEQFRTGAVEKVYVAVVEGRLEPDSGTWHDFLAKDRAANLVSTRSNAGEGTVEAVVDFLVVDREPSRTWVELRPRTGRSHQLRVQLASRGLPIVGDRKYGARTNATASDGGPRIALHARDLSFDHPTLRDRITISAPVPFSRSIGR
ncbi:MAG: RluA family pseudouridine synthase [Isosphaeraceae bacterium]|nr:RluA family pseudouridine synthase [Isosphaeraceae bacterium]